MLKKLIPWIAWAVSVWISDQYAGGYWVVGSVFGIAVLIANLKRILPNFSPKYFVFLMVSTLVYALVYGLSSKGWRFQSDWVDMLAGATTAGVIVGSLLLPAVHAYLFGTDVKTVRRVSIKLIVSWYLMILISWIDDSLNVPLSIDYLLIAIALWQGIYIKNMKIKSP